jgi:hypothetical protein
MIFAFIRSSSLSQALFELADFAVEPEQVKNEPEPDDKHDTHDNVQLILRKKIHG